MTTYYAVTFKDHKINVIQNTSEALYRQLLQQPGSCFLCIKKWKSKLSMLTKGAWLFMCDPASNGASWECRSLIILWNGRCLWGTCFRWWWIRCFSVFSMARLLTSVSVVWACNSIDAQTPIASFWCKPRLGSSTSDLHFSMDTKDRPLPFLLLLSIPFNTLFNQYQFLLSAHFPPVL